MRSLLLALGLAACAASPPPATDLPPLGTALVCNADTDAEVSAAGARTDDGQLSVPLALTLPAGEGPGELCIATGCYEAAVMRTPLSRTRDWAARIESASDGVVTVSDDRRRFEFSQARADGAAIVWSGTCAPAGS